MSGSQRLTAGWVKRTLKLGLSDGAFVEVVDGPNRGRKGCDGCSRAGSGQSGTVPGGVRAGRPGSLAQGFGYTAEKLANDPERFDLRQISTHWAVSNYSCRLTA